MVEVVAYAQVDSIEVRNFTLSLKRLGFSYTILEEKKEDGVTKGEVWVDFTHKIVSYLDYLTILPEEKLVLLCEAYDTIAQRGPEDLLSFYRFYNRPLVVGADLLCHKHDCYKLEKYWLHREKPLRNLHADIGFCLGPVKELKELCTYLLRQSVPEDQIALGMYIEENAHKVALDINSLLVANVNYLQLGHIERKEGLYYSVTKSKPCFWRAIHSNLDILRYNYIGRRILQEEFLSPPLSRLGEFWKRKVTLSLNRYSILFAVLLLLFFFLSLLSPELFFLVLTLLLLFIVLFMREGYI